MLFFNFDSYDFWPIYDCINNFYPIGIAQPERDIFDYFPGTRALVDITKKNIHDEANYKNKWLSFLSQIEQHIKITVLDTTYGQAPSFSCAIELERNELMGVKRIKELHLFVSLVGPFYCVIGKDRNEIIIGDNLIQSVNYLLVSPEQQPFSNTFLLLCQLVETQFSDFRFVPFFVNKMEIKGIQIAYAVEKREAVFHALFHDQLSLTDSTFGNEYFLFERWKAETPNKDENSVWTIGPPLESV